MKIIAQVKANSKKPGVEKTSETNFVVRVREVAKDGEANTAVINAMAEYFKIAKSRIKITRGLKSKTKGIEII